MLKSSGPGTIKTRISPQEEDGKKEKEKKRAGEKARSLLAPPPGTGEQVDGEVLLSTRCVRVSKAKSSRSRFATNVLLKNVFQQGKDSKAREEAKGLNF